MGKVLLILGTAFLLTGCISYRGGTLSPDLGGSDTVHASGTMGVSSGDMPGEGITGSDAVPHR